MKTRIAVVAVALSFIAAAASFAASPQVGTWKLNEGKSKIPAGMGKNNMVVYAEAKDKMKVTVDGVDKDGKPTHSVWVGMFDGKSYPVKGNLPYNSVAYKMVNDRTPQRHHRDEGRQDNVVGTDQGLSGWQIAHGQH